MAVDMFLKLDGIQGEAQDAKHKNEIDILSFSWGAANQAYGHVGGGSGIGKVNVADLSITKYVDKSSPSLFLNCCNGNHVANAVFVIRKSGKDPLEYYTVKMAEVFISSIQWADAGSSERLIESVTLNFSKVNIEYKEQNPDGKAGPSSKVGWNIATNAEAA